MQLFRLVQCVTTYLAIQYFWALLDHLPTQTQNFNIAILFSSTNTIICNIFICILEKFCETTTSLKED